MKHTSKLLGGVGLAAMLSGGSLASAAPGPTGAPSTPIDAGEHCVAEALPPELVDKGGTPKVRCFDTFEGVASFLGAGDVASLAGLTPQEFVSDPQYAAASSNTLAIHWAYTSNPGSITITGGQCNGGGLNLSSAWDNRIEATIHKGCGTIKHWDGDNYTGDMEQTQGGWDDNVWLGPLSGRTNSIKYYA